MKISSTAFNDVSTIPVKYSRQGGDISPPLTFQDIPANAQSLALVCHDPDAPRTEGWTHWIVWNIAPKSLGFDEGNISAGAIQGVTDWGENHWGGPQPPSGTHRYNFYLYALDTMLSIPSSSSHIALEKAIRSHVIESAVLTGLFSA